MGGQNCPKCGADQVMNDQCLKCGIVVSKYLNATHTASQPVSFVAASQAHKEYSYTISKDHLDYAERRSKDRLQRIFVGIGILVAVGLLAFLAWRLISHRASEFSGQYTNGELIYGIYFPPTGPKWYHGRANKLESLGIKDPHDAFYRGENRNEPDVAMAVYVASIQHVPEKISAERKEKLFADAEDSLMSRMREQGVHCEIVDSYPKSIGGREGLIIEAEIDRDGKLYRAYVLNGYYYSRAYTVFFVGPDEIVTDNDELKRVMDSFSFKTSVL